MEEMLLTKGVDYADVQSSNKPYVTLKDLEDFTLVVYGLKVNATNKIYVGAVITKQYLKKGLLSPNNKNVTVPMDIYEKVKSENNKYRKP